MSTLTIKLDDELARLVEKAALVTNQPLDHWLRESISQAARRTVNVATAHLPRISPLHPGAMQPSPDFNSPLAEFAPYVFATDRTA